MLLSLDFIYMPSRDVEQDLMFFSEVPGVEVVFNIKDMGTQVAMFKLGSGPRLLLADHLEGELPILIYRVANLRKAMKELKIRGWKKEREVEIPHGPCCTYIAGGKRFAIYELTRPEADEVLTRR
jgi:hypothetical protein